MTEEQSHRREGPGHALIIEDDMIIALEIEDHLRDLGFGSFDVAATPQEALDHALRMRPDLMTVDVRIVGGTGIEAVGAIVAQLGEIPHIFVTGNIDMLVAVQAPIVEKPINALHLRRAYDAATASI